MKEEEKEEWEIIYREYPLEGIPWHSEEPAEYLVDLLKEKKVKIGLALDVCSGAGKNAVYLAKKGFDVTGIDISPTAIKYAKKRAREAGVSERCKFFTGNVTEMKIPKDNFDFIFDRGCYHHIPKEDKPKFVKIISDSLKKGGKYFLSCFSDKNPPWEKNVSKEEIRENFSEYFHIGRIKDFVTIEKTGRRLHLYLVLMTKK
ncbi:MAG: class I SAM-dependent methyltransferase [archaeon]|nr:class I SAM-dependent methyltransferase [archaeon]